MVIFSFLPSLI
jgi:hypothetical protein